MASPAHPCTSRLAAGKLSLHGWFFDINTGEIHALGQDGEFHLVDGKSEVPVAVPARVRGAGRFEKAA